MNCAYCRSGRDKAINPNHLHLALVGGSRERERDLTVIDGPELADKEI